MKKISIVKWIGIILFFVYITLIVVDLIFEVLGDYRILILSLVLALISMNMISKGVIIKSSSTLWFALTLILFAILIAIFELKNINPTEYYYIFSIIPIISSVINLAIFQNLIYIKVIILNISIVIPIFILYFFQLHLLLNLLIFVISIGLGIIISRGIPLNKENE